VELRVHLPFCMALMAREKVVTVGSRKSGFFGLVTLIACVAMIVQAIGQTPPSASGPVRTQKPGNAVDPGERVFNANCARCHIPPGTLNPRITRTVVMHMRVRARLSESDEKLLLKYLAP
jgi:hypothetical protein